MKAGILPLDKHKRLLLGPNMSLQRVWIDIPLIEEIGTDSTLCRRLEDALASDVGGG